MSTQQIRQQIVIDAVNNTTRGFSAVNNNLSRLSAQAERTNRFFERLRENLIGLVGFHVGVEVVKELSKMSDSAVEIDAKMQIVTDTTEDANAAFNELTAISLKTGTAVADNITLFTRINKPITAMGYSLKDSLTVTEALANSLRLSGASYQETSSTITQFSQAMASGVLRGEEFNSLNENSPRIMQALANSLEITSGELRAMAGEGELTSEVVINAIREQSEAIRSESEKLPLTIARSLVNLKTQIFVFMGELKGVNAGIANVFQGLSEHVDVIFDVLTVLGAAFLAFTTKYILGRTQEYAATARLAGVEMQRANQARVISQQEAVRDAQWAANAAARVIREKELAIAQINAARTRLETARQLLVVQRQSDIAQMQAIINTNTENLSVRERNLLLQQRFAIQNSLIAQDRVLNGASADLARNSDNLRNATTDLNTARVDANRTNRESVTALERLQEAETTAARSTNNLGSRISALSSNAVAFAGGAAMWGYIAYEVGKSLLGMAVGTEQASIEIDSGMIRMKLSIVRFVAGADLAFSVLKAAMLSMVAAVPIVGERLTGGFDKIYDDLGASYTKFQNVMTEIDKDRDAQIDALYTKAALKREGFNSEQEKHDKAVRLAKQADIQQIAAITKAETRLSELRAKFLEIETEGLDGKAELINAQAQAKISAMDLELERSQTHSDKLKNLDVEELSGYVDTLNSRYKLLTKATNDSLAEWKKYYTAKAKGLQANGIDDLRLQTQSAEKEKGIIKDRIDYQATQIDKLKKLRAGLYEGIAESESNIKELVKSSEEFIRSQRGETLSESEKSYAAFNNLVTINGNLNRANALDIKTDAEEVKEVRDAAKKDLEALITSETERSKQSNLSTIERLDAEQNVSNAMNAYKKLVADSVRDERTLSAFRAKNAKTLDEQIDKRTESMQSYKKRISELDEQLAKTRIATIELNTKELKIQIKNAESALDKLTRKRVASVLVNIENDTLPEYKDPVKAQRAETLTAVGSGSGVAGFNTGGSTNSPFISRSDKVSGYGHGDNVPAMLERGEFIIRKSVVDNLGDPFLNAINNGLPPEQATALVSMNNTTDERLQKAQENPIIYRSTGGKVDSNERLDIFDRRDAKATEDSKELDIFDRRALTLKTKDKNLNVTAADWKDPYNKQLQSLQDIDTSDFLPFDARMIENAITDTESYLNRMRDGVSVARFDDSRNLFFDSVTRTMDLIGDAPEKKALNDRRVAEADALAELLAEEQKEQTATKEEQEGLQEEAYAAMQAEKRTIREAAEAAEAAKQAEINRKSDAAVLQFANADWLKEQQINQTSNTTTAQTSNTTTPQKMSGVEHYKWLQDQQAQQGKLDFLNVDNIEFDVEDLIAKEIQARLSKTEMVSSTNPETLLKASINEKLSSVGEFENSTYKRTSTDEKERIQTNNASFFESKEQEKADRAAGILEENNARRAKEEAEKVRAAKEEEVAEEAAEAKAEILADEARWAEEEAERARQIDAITPKKENEFANSKLASLARLSEEAKAADLAARELEDKKREGLEQQEKTFSENLKIKELELQELKDNGTTEYHQFEAKAEVEKAKRNLSRITEKLRTHDNEANTRRGAVESEQNARNETIKEEEEDAETLRLEQNAIIAAEDARIKAEEDAEAAAEAAEEAAEDALKAAEDAAEAAAEKAEQEAEEAAEAAEKEAERIATLPTFTDVTNTKLGALEARIKAATSGTYDMITKGAQSAMDRVRDVSTADYSAPVQQLNSSGIAGFNGRSTAETSESFNSASKKVSLTLNLNNQSVTGTFDDSSELDNILNALKLQQRVI